MVVIEKDRARDSKALEVLGHYNPVAHPAVVELNHDRIEHWRKLGAQLSDTLTRLVKANPPVVAPPVA